MAETILSFEQVSKRYGSIEVLKDISFPLRRGECVALTGLNGSGKTTALKLAAGLTRASRGKITAGKAVRIQYIPESFPRLNFSARGILHSFGRIEGMDKSSLDQRIGDLLGSFHLSPEAGSPLRTYSKGMLQKVSVIQAFLSNADILLLDEPLSGQDEASQETFLRLTKSLLSSGRAVLLACHERHLVRALADTVFELRQGSLYTAAVPPENSQDVYLFDTPHEGFVMPREFEELSSMERGAGTVLVAVRHGTGGQILKSLLEAGCSLREMRHEKDC